jgi:hypothetical protein
MMLLPYFAWFLAPLFSQRWLRFSRKAFEASLRWRFHRSLPALSFNGGVTDQIDESFDENLMGIQP